MKVIYKYVKVPTVIPQYEMEETFGMNYQQLCDLIEKEQIPNSMPFHSIGINKEHSFFWQEI